MTIDGNFPRRVFFSILGGAAAALVSLRSSMALAKGKVVAVSLDKLTSLKDVGGSTATKVKGLELVLVRDTDTTVKVLNRICTHKKCKVSWKKDLGLLKCKCHKSQFTLSGKVDGGPAKKDLPAYKSKLELDKNRVLIILPEQ